MTVMELREWLMEFDSTLEVTIQIPSQFCTEGDERNRTFTSRLTSIKQVVKPINEIILCPQINMAEGIVASWSPEEVKEIA